MMKRSKGRTMIGKYFILKLCSDKIYSIDQNQASVIRKTIEHIGARLNLNLTDFVIEGGRVRFRFDRLDSAYDILESVVDEIGVRPALIGWSRPARARRVAV